MSYWPVVMFCVAHHTCLFPLTLCTVVNQLKDICCNETLEYSEGTVAHTLTKVHYFYHTFPTIIHEPMVKHKREAGSTV